MKFKGPADPLQPFLEELFTKVCCSSVLHRPGPTQRPVQADEAQ